MNDTSENRDARPRGEDGRRSPITSASMDPDNNEYATPPEIWRPLSRAVGGFDLDAASGAESTPIAPDRLTKDDDGLTQPWHGNVWLNPPWSTNGNGSAKSTGSVRSTTRLTELPSTESSLSCRSTQARIGSTITFWTLTRSVSSVPVVSVSKEATGTPRSAC
jgi:DNA N-6-adenine-methyltransferase (Dam).